MIVIGLRRSGMTMGSILVCLAGTMASVAVEADAIALVLCFVSGLSELPLSFLRARLSIFLILQNK